MGGHIANMYVVEYVNILERNSNIGYIMDLRTKLCNGRWKKETKKLLQYMECKKITENYMSDMKRRYKKIPLDVPDPYRDEDCPGVYYQRHAQFQFYNTTYWTLVEYFDDLTRALKKSRRRERLDFMPINSTDCQDFGQRILDMTYTVVYCYQDFKYFMQQFEDYIFEQNLEYSDKYNFQMHHLKECKENRKMVNRMRKSRHYVNWEIRKVFTHYAVRFGYENTDKFWEVIMKNTSLLLDSHKGWED
ncbi:hypothetical protein ACOME3_010750 [Neoechinorhynchus agilis]